MLARRATLKERVDRFLRHLLVFWVGILFGVRRRPVSLPAAPRILLVRLDQRVGNVIMTTALLGSLKARFPAARIDLLGDKKNAALFNAHPHLARYLVFDKRALFAPFGPLRTPFALRAMRYDLAIDVSNATDPSSTQALLVRLCGAKHSVGFDFPGFGRLFSAAVPPMEAGVHEIDHRLALLAPVPGETRSRTTHLTVAEPSEPVRALLAATPRFALVNLGARLLNKRLDDDTYAQVVRALLRHTPAVVLTYGPSERELAEAVQGREPKAVLAPKTSLPELACLMARASRVVSCDTGPMHLAVAVGTRTCGIFVSTEPSRYGYGTPHAAIDARDGDVERWLPELFAWLTASALAERSEST